jgi:CheY-like chemotaxis protein
LSHVLIVEDDQDIRESLQELLKLEGYEVSTAINGQEAVKKLSSMKRPCLILLDLMMPVMNGWEFLAIRKNMDVIATIPVVVVSAVAEKNQASDVNEFVKKPVDLDSLVKVVSRYCVHHGSEKAAEAG